ncbi:MAG: putative toxin-antitoxin system toxin component, PIN family [Thermomicrobiales bacterium]
MGAVCSRAPSLMIVLLDTNIFISAFMTSGTPPDRIYNHWRAKAFILATCFDQLEELRRVSRYTQMRPRLQQHRVGTLINLLQDTDYAFYYDIKIGEVARDPDDSWMLALATASRAHFLVTGDKRAGILERRSVAQAEVITATDFCRRLGI